ncbi:uncharacterized protein LOC109863603 isoform X1 [Pseudomyrmex gracilis]|uniref:uncharacterized protein LOC109863603 isoform X1 n=1 Tax=Pseudomyrmex gracilis TaxID=219809 RepID=UPI0009951B03|nr:uncharacterized protein LOC109863603 isoform X1 [Pseudomyrmex gracilis]
MQALIILLLISCVHLLSARPAEGPTKFVLNTTENIENNVSSSKLEEAKELLRRISDTISHGRGRLISLIILARNIIVDRVEQLTSEVSNAAVIKHSISNKPTQNRRSVFLEQITTTVSSMDNLIRLENERDQGLLEKLAIPPFIKEGLYNALTPRPLVDRIREEEKYGNTNTKFDGIERAFVNGYTSFSQGLVSLLDAIPLLEPKRGTVRDQVFRQNLNRVTSVVDNLAKTKVLGL